MPSSPRLGFDFTLHVRGVCEDLVARLPALRHIDMTRVAVSFCQARKATEHGMYATLTPLRFAGGATHVVRRGRRWSVQRLPGPGGREMLYILNIYVPRFLELPFLEKLRTLVHELWHISPEFHGDVRRFRGRCYAHGHSQARYDAHAARLVDEWLATEPSETVYSFLRLTFGELSARHGRIYGQKIRAPRLVPGE